ncbi:MAG: hypothetical protein RLZZ165_2435, partial [Bacteroidota bacterium]
TDPGGSADRQAILALILALAEAVGRPLAQRPRDAIGKDFDHFGIDVGGREE